MVFSKFDTNKINSEIKDLVATYEDKVDFSKAKFSQYNVSDCKYSGMLLITQMKSHVNDSILPAYVLARHSKSDDEKMFFCNYLCILLYSFLELYAQSLNVFYDLRILPVHKMPVNNPLMNAGVVEQSLEGLENKQGKTVSIETVMKEIQQIYKLNEYFAVIKKIVESEDMARLKELRNYQMHYQSIFCRFTQSYSFQNNESVFNMEINPKGKPFREKEYSLFLELADNIIEKEFNLTSCFLGMITDKKMIRLDEEEKELCTIQCLKCKRRFAFPKEIIDLLKKVDFSVPHSGCVGQFDFEVIEKSNVHPELHNRIILETMKLLV